MTRFAERGFRVGPGGDLHRRVDLCHRPPDGLCNRIRSGDLRARTELRHVVVDEGAIWLGDFHAHARDRILAEAGRRRRARQNKFSANAKQSRL